MIYTITLKNKKTGRHISRDYYLDPEDGIKEDDILREMLTTLKKYENEKVPF